MGAIDILGHGYDRVRAARREFEAEARETVEQRMTAIKSEFDALVLRAHGEGATVSAIAREMGASRTLVYQILDRARTAQGSASALINDPLAFKYALTPASPEQIAAGTQPFTVTMGDGDNPQPVPFELRTRADGSCYTALSASDSFDSAAARFLDTPAGEQEAVAWVTARI